MAFWTLRTPQEFHPAFLRGLLAGEGTGKLLGQAYTEGGIRRMQREWQLFRFCVRQIGSLEMVRAERDFTHYAKCRFSHEHNVWQLLLDSHPRLLEQQLEKILRDSC